MTRYVAVPGTWGWRDRDDPAAWFRAGSPFAAEVRVLGIAPLRAEPFLWTTRINGTEGWRRWFSWVIPASWERGDHLDWQAGAEALRYYCEADAAPDVVVAHSHGGQLVAYAIAAGYVTPRLLVTVSTPPRGDMQDVYEAARVALDARGGRWRHLHAATLDFWQRAGVGGDGRVNLRGVGAMPAGTAHDNYPVPGAGHTRVLNDAAFTRRWLVDTGRLV